MKEIKLHLNKKLLHAKIKIINEQLNDLETKKSLLLDEKIKLEDLLNKQSNNFGVNHD